jgi:hypothetical protein
MEEYSESGFSIGSLLKCPFDDETDLTGGPGKDSGSTSISALGSGGVLPVSKSTINSESLIHI